MAAIETVGCVTAVGSDWALFYNLSRNTLAYEQELRLSQLSLKRILSSTDLKIEIISHYDAHRIYRNGTLRISKRLIKILDRYSMVN